MPRITLQQEIMGSVIAGAHDWLKKGVVGRLLVFRAPQIRQIGQEAIVLVKGQKQGSFDAQ